ncbi:hypothetical protein LshimejAT787_0304510 [Lyophyllum shimeji]|uniref:Protein CPL1-like domain-containing protein n=1 Tax=Lyophyllum shimeji TaxID=47721 RepID=A0A9P3PHS1_LYOSH|nr:hypothetical protein LshimejAT787_0304510 [Lyophyllum shimeji]
MGAACALLFIALPFASSTATGSKSCTQKEFWSVPNGCCLPIGGPPTPPPPPKGNACPPTTHYWGQEQGCCVPRHPPPEHGPPPQCPRGWTWNQTVRKCYPTPTTSTPSSPQPSKHHGHGHDGQGHDGHGHDADGPGGHWKKRSAQLKSRSAPLCPTGLDACPISGAKGGDYECLDTATELESCGGCTSLGSGQDCTAIAGAWNVGCEQGRCIAYTCAGGFNRSRDGKSCIPL